MKKTVRKKRRNLDLNALLGQRLAAIRAEQGISQEDIAQRMGFGRPNVSKIEHGQRELAACEIPDYAAALKVEPDVIFDELYRVVIEYDTSLRRANEQGTPGSGMTKNA